MNPLTEYWLQIYREAAREDGLSPETSEALFRQVDVLRAELTRVTVARHKADAQAGALARELVQTKLLLTEAKTDRDEALEELTNSRAMQSTIDTLTHELTQTRAEAGAEVERVHAKLAGVTAANQVLGNQVTSLVKELREAKEAAASANTAQLRAFEGKDRYREDVAKLTAALAHIKVVVEDRMTEYYPHTALDQILKTVRGIAP